MKVAWFFGALLFALALVLALISSNLRWLVNDPDLYAAGFDKYRIEEVTGISRSELLKGAAGLRSYFNSGEDLINVKVEKDGQTIDLFRNREVVHLKDVKGLFNLFNRLQTLSLAFVAIFVGLVLWRKRPWPRYLARLVFWSGALALGLLIGVGLLSLLDFESLFLQFHLLSFSNDTWMLDPSRDYLIMMFPEGFWFDCAMRLAGYATLEAVVAMSISGVFLLGSRKGK